MTQAVTCIAGARSGLRVDLSDDLMAAVQARAVVMGCSCSDVVAFELRCSLSDHFPSLVGEVGS